MSHDAIIIDQGRKISGIPTNILRGIVPVASGFGDAPIGYCFTYIATVYSDQTANANSAAANDVTMVTNSGDIIYFSKTGNQAPGGDATHDAQAYAGYLKLNVGTAGTVGTGVWEYYNGTAWVTLTTVLDQTNQLKTAGAALMLEYLMPSDMAAIAVNGQSAKWLRFRCTGNYTISPLLTQAWFDGTPDQLRNITDGNMSTSSGTGTTITGSNGYFGIITFDLGSIKTIQVGGRRGAWSSTGYVGYVWGSSNDNITWRDGGNVLDTQTSVSEGVVEIIVTPILTGRYIRIKTYNSAASTANTKIYSIMGYERSI